MVMVPSATSREVSRPNNTGRRLSPLQAKGPPNNLEGTEMPTGKVKFYNDDKGFGFIMPDAGGIDLFFHITNCDESIDTLEKDQRVKFEERTSPRNGKVEAYEVGLL
jgi:cold shock protein